MKIISGIYLPNLSYPGSTSSKTILLPLFLLLAFFVSLSSSWADSSKDTDSLTSVFRYGCFSSASQDKAALETLAEPKTASTPAELPIIRFAAAESGKYYYSTGEGIAGYRQLKTEGYVYGRQTGETKPLYRYTAKSGKNSIYALAMDPVDRAALKNRGFVEDAIIGYANSSAAPGTRPLYQLHHNNRGILFYTSSAEEKDRAIADYGYTYDRITAFVRNLPGRPTDPILDISYPALRQAHDMQWLNPANGTVEFLIKPSWGGSNNLSHNLLKAEEALHLSYMPENTAFTVRLFGSVTANLDVSKWKDREWHHIAVTWKDGQVKHYIDGELQCSSANIYGTASAREKWLQDRRLQVFVGADETEKHISDTTINNVRIFAYAKEQGEIAVTPPATCGDGLWQKEETLYNCRRDCSDYCIDPPDQLKVSRTGDYIIGTFLYPGWHESPASNLPKRKSSLKMKDLWDPVIKLKTPVVKGQSAPRTPLLGYYDDSNPVAVNWMLKWGLEHGVSLYVYDWYWYTKQPSLQEAVEQGFLKSKYLDLYPDQIKFAVMWTNQNEYKDIDSELLEKDLDAMMDYVIDHYFSKQQYFRINDKPVFIIYNAATLTNKFGVDKAEAILQSWDKKAKSKKLPGIHFVMDCTWRLTEDPINPLLGLHRNWSAYSHYPQAFAKEKQQTPGGAYYTDYSNFVSEFKNTWERIIGAGNPYSVIADHYIPVIMPDQDTTPWKGNKPDARITINSSPLLYRQMLLNAKDFVDNNYRLKGLPLIIMNQAWDEWAEGAVLAPTTQRGMSYLEQIQQVFGH